MEIVSLIISAVAILFNIWIYVKFNHKLNKQQLQINDIILQDHQRKEKERKQAKLQIRHEYGGNGSGDIFIDNIGMADARNVRMEVKLNPNPGIYIRNHGMFPYQFIAPGGFIKIHYGLDEGFQKDPIFVLRWDDDSADDNIMKQAVQLN